MQRSATFSRRKANRLTLARDWEAGPRVCFIGLNPSTADHRVDDPTVRRWIHFARVWGYGGFTAVNLYPFRTPSPAVCRRWAAEAPAGSNRSVRDDLARNLVVVAREAKAANLVVACWGAAAWDLNWVEAVVAVLGSGAGPWPRLHCFGTTAGGAPIHPMARGRRRVPDDARPVAWRAAFECQVKKETPPLG